MITVAILCSGRLLVLSFLAITLVTACSPSDIPAEEPGPESSRDKRSVARRFAYPVGDGNAVTQAKDSADDWYNAQDFGENRHLGEDWNKNSGGNSDCGATVRAAAEGSVSFAGDAGPGWGNVVIVTHSLPDGREVQTLYGHLEKIERAEGTVKAGEKIGSVGNAGGTYLCHLHFELRNPDCRFWDQTGPGYSDDRKGWLDPSDFIDSRLKASPSR